MYELIDTVDRCFCEIINDQDFILGLDTTGVFAFTESSNKEEVQLSFYDLKKDLQLSDRQAVLCYVGEKHPGFKNEVLLTDLEDWIRETTSKRSRIFSRDDLQSIEDCYDGNSEEDLSIVDVLREYDLSDAIIHELIENKPTSVKAVKQLGVVDEVANDVFRILRTGLYERDNTTEERVQSGVAVTMTSYAKKKCLVSFLFAVVSGVLIYTLNYQIAAIISSLIGFGYGKRASVAGDLVSAKIAVLVNVVLAGFAVLRLVVGLAMTYPI